MKSIEDWTRDIAEANNKTSAQGELEPTWELFEYADSVDVDALGRVFAVCQGCGEWKRVECEPRDFDPTYHYCGGSPRCCP